MEYFTTRNTVIVALAQVGVIVAGVLAAGAAHKWYAVPGVKLPSSTVLLAEYGYIALVLPVAWATVALLIMRQNYDSEAPRWLAFFSGIVVVLLLLFGVWQAAARPLLRVMSGFS